MSACEKRLARESDAEDVRAMFDDQTNPLVGNSVPQRDRRTRGTYYKPPVRRDGCASAVIVDQPF